MSQFKSSNLVTEVTGLLVSVLQVRSLLSPSNFVYEILISENVVFIIKNRR